jgi:hypothetical protein
MDAIKESVGVIAEESKKVKNEVTDKIVGFLTGAFGLVAGLAWNDAITALIEYVFPLDKGSLIAKFIYAFLLTIILVVVTIYLIRFLKKDE